MKNKNTIKIAPSLIAVDFTKLKQQIQQAEKAGADWLHLDIMDGHFVPNITFGPIIIKAVRSLTKLPLDTHLMIENPDKFLEDFKNAGCDILTVHVENCTHLHRTISHIKKLGIKAGISLNPATPAITLKEIIQYVDLVLVMSVNPGFSGQKFIPSTLKKIKEIDSMIKTQSHRVYLEVDGGVSPENARELINAGANVLVAGYSIFSKNNISRAIKDLRISATAI